MKLIYNTLGTGRLPRVLYDDVIYPAMLRVLGLPKRHRAIRKPNLAQATGDVLSRLGQKVDNSVIIVTDMSGDLGKAAELMTQLPKTTVLYVVAVEETGVRNAKKFNKILGQVTLGVDVLVCTVEITRETSSTEGVVIDLFTRKRRN